MRFIDSESSECPVCPTLLQRLSFLSGKPIWDHDSEEEVYVDHFVDPFLGSVTPLPSEGFQQAARLVLFTDTSYIILCPGSEAKLIAIAQTSGAAWKDTPFIADSRNLSITTRLVADEDMRLDEGEAVPSILEYDGTNHIVDFGRQSVHLALIIDL